MSRSFRSVLLALFFSGVAMVMQPLLAAGQGLPHGGATFQRKPITEVLALFEQENLAEQPKNLGGAMTISYVLSNTDGVPKATVDSVLSGLEEMSLNGATQRVRTAAASTLAFTGDTRRANPLPGALDRSLRIYRRSHDPLVRATLLPVLPFYAEKDRVAAFLKTVATQSQSEQDYPEAPAQAISALARMGERGQAALRDLLQRRSVRHPGAEANLRHILQQKH